MELQQTKACINTYKRSPTRKKNLGTYFQVKHLFRFYLQNSSILRGLVGGCLLPLLCLGLIPPVDLEPRHSGLLRHYTPNNRYGIKRILKLFLCVTFFLWIATSPTSRSIATKVLYSLIFVFSFKTEKFFFLKNLNIFGILFTFVNLFRIQFLLTRPYMWIRAVSGVSWGSSFSSSDSTIPVNLGGVWGLREVLLHFLRLDHTCESGRCPGSLGGSPSVPQTRSRCSRNIQL